MKHASGFGQQPDWLCTGRGVGVCVCETCLRAVPSCTFDWHVDVATAGRWLACQLKLTTPSDSSLARQRGGRAEGLDEDEDLLAHFNRLKVDFNFIWFHLIWLHTLSMCPGGWFQSWIWQWHWAPGTRHRELDPFATLGHHLLVSWAQVTPQDYSVFCGESSCTW